jgi:acyl-CoA dehydrogenase
MIPAPTKRAEELRERVTAFLNEHILPAEPVFERQLTEAADRWSVPPIIEELKKKARAAGLWNLFLPKREYPDGLSNQEYAILCEVMGRSPIGPEPFNCSAPDTGNMETIARYGDRRAEEAVARTAARRKNPLLLRHDGARGRLVGRHEHPVGDQARRRSLRHQRPQMVDVGRARQALQDRDLHGADRPVGAPHKRQSMVLVPMDTPGVNVIRPLQVFGYDDAPHGHAEVEFKNVRVPVSNILLGEGRGFEIAQGRLGPGRIHHCMRRSASPSARWKP